METTDTLLYYKGIIEYKMVNSLIKQLQDEFSKRSLPVSLYKKALVAMIEMLENIYKYCDEKCMGEIDKPYLPEVRITQEDGHFVIRAANPVHLEDKGVLLHRLEQLNQLNHAEILEEYKKTLMNGVFSEKGGAGLGLLEIARVALGEINYTFEPIGKQLEYYVIKVTID